MGLQVIGAGFGRTGTLSLKNALEQLGFGRCYHMYEVLSHLDHAQVWVDAAAGQKVDFDQIFDGYAATVDWPGCVFWRELAAEYPEAKVLLSVRPPERWYASFHDTIYQVITRPVPADMPEAFQPVLALGEQVVKHASFGSNLESLSRDEIIATYEAHNEAVRRGIPADRLLEFDVAEGWDPLCAFLGVDVPEEPFPNVNDREMFRQLFRLDDDPAGASGQRTLADVEQEFRNAGGKPR